MVEDEELIGLNKPPGLLVLPDRYNELLPNLYRLLADELGSAFIVHRIDRDTSGVVVFAKTLESHAALNAQFQTRRVAKIYLGLVQGQPSPNEGVIELALTEDEARRGRMRVARRGGKPSQTRYRVLESLGEFSVLELKPLTGRTHQIRVHLAGIGHPIVGDPLYGDGQPFFLSSVKRSYRSSEEEKPLLRRTGLHARRLQFTHPKTGAAIDLEAELPKDLRSTIRALRKYAGGGSAV